MDKPFQDTCCLVTGGSRGIGRSIVDSLIDHGAKVLCVARNANSIKYKENYYPYHYDLFQKNQIDSFLKQLSEDSHFPDIIIHNLGGSRQITSDFASIEYWLSV